MGEAQIKMMDDVYPIDRAIELVEEALALLDASEAPADIGAHLDLALHRMRGEGALDK